MTTRTTIMSATALILSTTLLSTPVRADFGNDDSNWYVGASIGRYNVNSTVDGIVLDDSSSTYRLFGGFDFNRYVGVEAQYINFGDLDGSVTIGNTSVTATADANGFGIAGVARIPLGNTFNLTGRLGYLAWDVDVVAADVIDGESDNDIFFGIGAEWAIADRWTIGADYERYTLDDVDLNVWTVGSRFRF